VTKIHFADAVYRYDQNGLLDTVLFKLQNGLLLHHQPFPSPISVECLVLYYKMEYMDANQEIISETYNIWVQYIESEENDLNYPFQSPVYSCPELYFCWTPLNQILQCQKFLSASIRMLALSNCYTKTQPWILYPQVQVYVVAIPIQIKDQHSWADWIHRFMHVVKCTKPIYHKPEEAVVVQLLLV